MTKLYRDFFLFNLRYLTLYIGKYNQIINLSQVYLLVLTSRHKYIAILILRHKKEDE